MGRLTMSELPKWGVDPCPDGCFCEHCVNPEVPLLRAVAGDAARQMILNAEQQVEPLRARLLSLAEHPESANWSSLTRLVELIEQAYVLAVESALDE